MQKMIAIGKAVVTALPETSSHEKKKTGYGDFPWQKFGGL
jgi:hypothetical protein